MIEPEPQQDLPDAEALFARAVKHHQAGELADAETLYRAVLAERPDNANAWNGLGVIAQKIGMYDVSAELLIQATEIDPTNPLYFFNLGNLYHAAGEFNQEIIAYTQAIELNPDYFEPYANLAYSLHERNFHTEAATLYKRATELRPSDAETRYNLANVLVELDDCTGAIAQLEQLLDTHSDVAEIQFGLGRALQKMGRLDEAAIAYEKAINLNAEMSEAHHNLGILLRARGDLEGAAQRLLTAVSQDQTLTNAKVTLGATLRDLGRTEEALRVLQEASETNPHDPLAHANLGTVLADIGHFEAAASAHEKALLLAPDRAELHMNYGIALQSLRRVDEAIAAYRHAIALDPNLREAHWNLALALLLKGDFAQGWPEFESRWTGGPLRNSGRNFAQPQWRGEDIKNKTILLHAEQGLGDTLQFIRYAPLVAERGARVIVECQPALLRLLKHSFPDIQVIARGEPLPAFEVHCPLMSLPLAFNTTLATIPARIPYLSAPAEQETYWKMSLKDEGERRVGLVWAGNPRAHDPAAHHIDQRRSLSFHYLFPLGYVPNVSFHSLQKGERSMDVRFSPNNLRVMDHSYALIDFTDTAALIEQMDLVISVDTAVAHLAGALGKPVWLLSRFDGCWRWLIDSSASPWYPTMRIFRQPRPGDWESVIREVGLAL